MLYDSQNPKLEDTLMNVIRIAAVSFLTLSLVVFCPGSFAGMHGDKESAGHSGSMGDKAGKVHMMEETHGKAMSGHGSTGEDLFSGSAFGTNLKGSMVDVKAKMAKMGKGMSAPAGITHHLMLTPDKPFGEGTVAKVVVTYPGGKTKEVELVAMGDHIGGDLNLEEKGTYHLDCIVTKGSEKESFPFDYEVK
jgi:hypothetical protein